MRQINASKLEDKHSHLFWGFPNFYGYQEDTKLVFP
jgi:hypothetical protein